MLRMHLSKVMALMIQNIESSSKDWRERDLTPSFLAVIGKVSLKALFGGRCEMMEVTARVLVLSWKKYCR